MSQPKRAVRIANCSGATSDPGVHMYNQAKYGPVDVITGDYLAEVNLAKNAKAMARSNHPGWVATAWDSLQQSLELLDEKCIKVIINSSTLNLKGLAEKTFALVQEKGLNLQAAYVDDIKAGVLQHLNRATSEVSLEKDTLTFLDHPDKMLVIIANAYLGYRVIKRGLNAGADIIICRRVADASPVLGAAAWWHGWPEDSFNALAGALVGGHLIKCSTYVPPIAEIDRYGHTTITKHEALHGFVTADTVKCQLLYELQGNIYLNSDVKADLTNIRIAQESENRVHVSSIKGYPPPSTTKLAEAQIKSKLEEWGVLKDFNILNIQRVSVPKENPNSQLASTTYCRIFAQARDAKTLGKVGMAWMFNGMAHFAGMHCSMDMRTIVPKLFLGFYPAIIPQSKLEEGVTILGNAPQRFLVGPPKVTEPLAPRDNYESANPVAPSEFGPTVSRPLGDIALARSGDKGANVNLGVFVQTAEQWEWLRSFLTREKMRQLMGKDWKDCYYIERVEMPHINAVHFVIYGPLGRGVSSSRLLDSLGKGFGEFIRAVHVQIPTKFLS
ncbi:hypothetical protein BJY00DRAFT_306309 [Aspergillus carlsbadensis]|nr:hypothetical protein BJY00DRAFT_306309 [Aspergillus carlsbadensis]